MENFVWMWIAVIVLAIVVEVVSDQLISIWFVPGAIVAAVLSLLNVSIVYQVLICLVLAAVGIVLAQIYLSKHRLKLDSRTNINAIIGERCVVTEKVDNFAGCGQVKVKGQFWSARGVSDEDIFEVGTVLSVVAIEGVKLICKKQ